VSYPRKELEKMMDLWLEANRNAERERNWAKYLGPHYTDDAVYRWNIGPKEEFVARGRQEIEQWALGVQMEGFEGWQYPYDKIVIDQKAGEVVAFWRQVAPYTRADGSPYEVAGLGGSWFRYGGDDKWSEQEDFFDFGNVMALLLELAADGHLNETVKQKIHKVAWGQQLPGHQPLPHAQQSVTRKIKSNVAMARIALLGR
jgi:hypothetical protein